jgi:PAS domain S-box-containing protein
MLDRQIVVDDLLDRAPCGFLSFTDDGTIRLINTTLLEMLGFERHELVDKPIERILNVGSRIFYQTHWFPLLRMHGRAEEIFLLLQSKSGEPIGCLVNAVRRERAGAACYDCIIMRVRERQKYEQELLRAKRAAEEASGELEQAGEELRTLNEDLIARTEEAERLRREADEANRAKSTFLAVMSHELRTPLNAISGYTELIDMGIHGPVTDAQHEALQRIQRSQRHLLRLINEVLNLARIEAGRINYDITEIRVEEIVDNVLPMIEPQAAGKGLRLLKATAPSARVRADGDKVQQILINLLSNAVKFTPAGGEIRLETESVAGNSTVVLRVTDTGIGIPPDKLLSVFEPFVQVDMSATRGPEGTGLGLTISRDLARGMGGDITAISTPGVGSSFELTLPAAH